MTDFEVSHGKPRPVLVRRTDIVVMEPRSDAERREGRAPDGTALEKNQIALGRGWKSAIRETVALSAKVVGVEQPADPEIVRLSNEAAILYRGILSSAPVTPPLMRMNVASAVREFVLANYFDAKAAEFGLMTEAGMALTTRASFHRQRCERLSVTAHALSQRPTKRKGKSKSEQIAAALDKEADSAK